MSLSSTSGTGKLTKLIFVGMLFLAFIALILMDVRGVMSNGPGVQDAATVNGERISTRDLAKRVDDAARRMGIPASEAAKVGLTQYVLQGMVSEKLSRQGIDTLGLRFSDKHVAGELRAMLVDPKDKNPAEAIKQRYELARRQSGLSQKQFEDEIRAGIGRRLVMESLKAGLLPDPLLDTVKASRNAEKRDITVITISTDPAAIKDAPDESEIEAMYNENQKGFTDPETRSGRLFTLPAAELADKGKADPEAYVMEIEDAFAGGDSLETVVKHYGLKAADTLKNVRQAEDKNPVSEALFSLNAGETSSAIALKDGETGFVVLDDIIPEKTRALAEVKPAIIAMWKRNEAVERARTLEAELRDAKDPIAFAREKKLTVENRKGVTLNDETLAPVFDEPLNKLVELKQASDTKIQLAIATSVTPGLSKWTAKEATMVQLQAAQSEDAMSYFYQMLVAWTKDVNVRINEKAIAAMNAQPAAATPAQ